MKTIIFLIVCLSTISIVYGSSVTVLTPSNFDAIVGNPQATFIKFFAPWCGHCKNMAPAWEELASKFAQQSSRVAIAEVDCDAHRDLCSRYGVSGYPTIKWFPAGSSGASDAAEDYNGGRDIEALSEFVSEKVGVVSPVITADDNTFADIVLNAKKGVFVKFYAPWCGHCKNLAPTWEKLAGVFQNEPEVSIVKINADTHRVASSHYNIQGYPTLIWFPADDKESYVQYSSGHNLESLVEFVNEHAGTQRTPDGSLNADAGRVPELDVLATAYVASAERESLRARAAAVQTGEKYSQKVYLSVMDNIAKKGNSFLQTESARLQNIISGGSLSLNKKDEFQKRLNILAAFTSD